MLGAPPRGHGEGEGHMPVLALRHGSIVLDSLNSPNERLTRRKRLVDRLSDCQAEWPDFEPCLRADLSVEVEAKYATATLRRWTESRRLFRTRTAD
jgi:hypothetical protein